MSVLVPQYPHRPNVRLDSFERPVEVRQEKKQFEITFEAKRRITLYLTFPSFGGVRICDSNRGFFEPEALCDILYETIDEHTIRMSGADTSAVLKTKEAHWELGIYGKDGALRTILKSSELFYGFDKSGEYQSVFLKLPIAEDEGLFGFGERFNNLEQKRTSLTMWNVDCLSGMPLANFADDYCEKTQAYKNVPIIHSNRRYSIFFNSYYPIRLDIGYTKPFELGVEMYGFQLDLYIWTGRTENNIKAYMALTGTPFLPPKWAFDYWMGGGWNVWNLPNDTYALKNIRATLDQYEEMGIHIHQAYLEMNPADEIFDELKRRQVRPLMWTNSCLLPRWGGKLDYRNYLVKKQSLPEEIMEFEYVDFTASKSQDVIRDKFSRVWDGGLKGMMIDYADNMPEDALCSNGKTGREMHNGYAYWYAKRMNEGFKNRLGDDFILFQRSGCAGSQHYSASFAGDIPVSFLGLKRSVWAGLTAAASGFSVWGSDLGGFYSVKDDKLDHLELYIRWLQFSTFSPLMRCHGLDPHDPWIYGDTAKECFKRYYGLRQCLLDKIYSTAVKSSVEGDTMMKSMATAFDLSPTIDNQYLFCDDFMVCPVVEQGKREADVILPEDGWTDLYTGEIFHAGTHTVPAPLEKIPVFVRAGSVIPVVVHEEQWKPTVDLERTATALFLTKPIESRSTTIYADRQDKTDFQSISTADGFEVIVSGECSRTLILASGRYLAEGRPEGEVLSCDYETSIHATVIRLQDNWKHIKLREVN